MTRNRAAGCRWVQPLVKLGLRSLDVFGALLGLLLSLPIFLLVPLLIKLDSPGPVFYRQLRTGINRRRRAASVAASPVEQRHEELYGKPFHIYKFRTMEEDAERRSGAVWAIQDDPRITAVGRWLRRLHLDEIPQFWNVLRGDMSLVGPRPERPEIIRRLVAAVPEYQNRLEVKPGITGPAQICLGYDNNIDDVRRKTQLDLLYISHRTLRLQLRLLALTLVKIFSSAATLDAKFIAPHLPKESRAG